jgi:hypothetical protein
MSLSTILVILALVAFVLATSGWSYKKIDLIAIGLALWALAEVIGRLSSLTLSTIFLILAFLAFVAAAVGWKVRKLTMVPIGLALWMLSILVASLVK